MESQLWYELMFKPATVIVWMHGNKDTREFTYLCNAIAFRQNGLEQGTHHVSSITSINGTVWNCE